MAEHLHDFDMPSASMAVINFDVPEWRDTEEGRGTLEWFMDPATIAEESGEYPPPLQLHILTCELRQSQVAGYQWRAPWVSVPS